MKENEKILARSEKINTSGSTWACLAMVPVGIWLLIDGNLHFQSEKIVSITI